MAAGSDSKASWQISLTPSWSPVAINPHWLQQKPGWHHYFRDRVCILWYLIEGNLGDAIFASSKAHSKQQTCSEQILNVWTYSIIHIQNENSIFEWKVSPSKLDYQIKNLAKLWVVQTFTWVFEIVSIAPNSETELQISYLLMSFFLRALIFTFVINTQPIPSQSSICLWWTLELYQAGFWVLIYIRGTLKEVQIFYCSAYLCTNVAFHRISAITIVGSPHKSPVIAINIPLESQRDSERPVIAIINE